MNTFSHLREDSAPKSSTAPRSEADACGSTGLGFSAAEGVPDSAAMAVLFQTLRSTADPPRAELLANSRYEFGEVFARGGLGQVRRTFDRVLGRTIAVKEMLASASSDRFMREAKVTAQLEHPAVVPVHDIGVHPNGQPYYCMKLIDGRSLETVISETHSLSERIMLIPNIVIVAEAVAFAHSKGLLHRDLKPANILIGNFGETWVIDWGLTGYIEQEEACLHTKDPGDCDPEQVRLTRTGQWMGTLPYMAPEQSGDRNIDERADVYGLGAVLYHTLSGLRPYGDVLDGRQLNYIATHPPTDLGLLVPNIAPELLTIVRKAMARDLPSRYASARALADELRHFLAGRLVGAHTYRVSDMIRRWAGRHRTSLLVGILSLLVLLGTGLYGVRRIAVERDSAVLNEIRAREHRIVADSARAEANGKAAEANEALSTLLEMEGRRALIDERRPLDAVAHLAQAAALAPERGYLKSMLFQAQRPLRALHCKGAISQSHGLVLHPTLPLVAIAHDFEVELWDTDSCTTSHVVPTKDYIRAVGFSKDGLDLRMLLTVRFWMAPAPLPCDKVTIMGYDPYTKATLGQASFPIENSFGLLAQVGDYAVFAQSSRPNGAAALSVSLMNFNGLSEPQIINLDAESIRISPNGTSMSWLRDGRITVRRGVESHVRRIVGARALHAVDDMGNTVVATEDRLEIHRGDGRVVTLERCHGTLGSDTQTGYFSFHPRAPLVAALSDRHNVSLWQADTGACVGSIVGRNVKRIEFADISEEPHILTLDGDDHLSVWHVKPGTGLERTLTLSEPESGIVDFDVHPTTGELVALGRDRYLRVWDLSALRETPPLLRAPILAVHRSGTIAAVADADGIRVIDLSHGDNTLASWQLPHLEMLRWEPSGALAARRGTELFDWDPMVAASPTSFDVGRIFDARGLEHSPVDETSLVVVSGTLIDSEGSLAPQDVRVYDRRDGQLHQFEVSHTVHHLPASQVSADGTRVILSDTGIVLDTGEIAVVTQLNDSAVFSPDGRGILNIEGVGGLMFYDAQTGARIERLDYESHMHSRRDASGNPLSDRYEPLSVRVNTRSVVFSPSGEFFAALGEGPDVQLWNHGNLSPLAVLQGPRLPLSDAFWSGDGSRVLTLNVNRARIWDAASGAQIAEFENIPPYAKIVASPTGSLVALQDSPQRLTLVEMKTGRRLLTVAVDTLVDVVFDTSEPRLILVEAAPGYDMSLRTLEIEEVIHCSTRSANVLGGPERHAKTAWNQCQP